MASPSSSSCSQKMLSAGSILVRGVFLGSFFLRGVLAQQIFSQLIENFCSVDNFYNSHDSYTALQETVGMIRPCNAAKWVPGRNSREEINRWDPKSGMNFDLYPCKVSEEDRQCMVEEGNALHSVCTFMFERLLRAVEEQNDGKITAIEETVSAVRQLNAWKGRNIWRADEDTFGKVVEGLVRIRNAGTRCSSDRNNGVECHSGVVGVETNGNPSPGDIINDVLSLDQQSKDSSRGRDDSQENLDTIRGLNIGKEILGELSEKIGISLISPVKFGEADKGNTHKKILKNHRSFTNYALARSVIAMHDRRDVGDSEYQLQSGDIDNIDQEDANTDSVDNLFLSRISPQCISSMHRSISRNAPWIWTTEQLFVEAEEIKLNNFSTMQQLYITTIQHLVEIFTQSWHMKYDSHRFFEAMEYDANQLNLRLGKIRMKNTPLNVKFMPDPLRNRLFEYPKEWAPNIKTRRWHVVCALARRTVARLKKEEELRLAALDIQKDDPFSSENKVLSSLLSLIPRPRKMIRIAEIGVFAGDTTLHMLENCTDSRGLIDGYEVQYHLVDPWRLDAVSFKIMLDWHQEFRGFEEQDGLELYKTVMRNVTEIPKGGFQFDVYEAEVRLLNNTDSNTTITIVKPMRISGREYISNTVVNVKHTGESSSGQIETTSLEEASFASKVNLIGDEHDIVPPSGGIHSRESSIKSGVKLENIIIESSSSSTKDGSSIVNLNYINPWLPGVFAHRATSKVAANAVREVDFLFVDGDHSFRGCNEDMRYFVGKTQTLVAGHDFEYYNFHGVIMAITNARTPGSNAYNQYGHRMGGKVFLDSENVWWNWIIK